MVVVLKGMNYGACVGPALALGVSGLEYLGEHVLSTFLENPDTFSFPLPFTFCVSVWGFWR